MPFLAKGFQDTGRLSGHLSLTSADILQPVNFASADLIHAACATGSDRYAGQQDLAGAHQVCLAHVLRDVQYAIDSGDTIFAPKIHDHLRWAIAVGRRRYNLKNGILVSYAAKAELKLSRLMHAPVAHPTGRALLQQIKAWRTKFFASLANRDVPATNNISERQIRPLVVFCKRCRA